MTRVAIVTDSTADLSADLRERHGIRMVPLNVHFGDEVFLDQINLSNDEFMERLDRQAVLPTTSQPASGQFEEVFRTLAQSHGGIVAVLISSRLSGTVNSATIARDTLAAKVPIEIVDSSNASLGLGFQVLRAAEWAVSGMTATEIAERLRSGTTAYHTLFFVDSLDHLRRGGRIGKASALLGSILDLKPILRIDEGLVVPVERPRTRARARRALIDFVRAMPKVERLAVLHNTTPDEARELADEFKLIVPREQVFICQMGPVIGAHVGPGTLGVVVDEGTTS